MHGPDEPISVLHVDDDPDLADLTSTYLEREDPRIEVETATDATAGIERHREDEVDCVVSDYDMPQRDGIEFLRSVREDDPDLPFILFTGKGSEEIASEAISAGVTDYLQKKPGTSQYEILANRIGNAVEQRRARDAAATTEQHLQSLSENTNDVLWMFTHDWGELLFINSAYEEIWGRSIAELRARPRSFLEGIHPDDRPVVLDVMKQLSSGESADIEYRVNGAEDYRRWVWIQAEPIFDDDGEVEKIVGFARDVTGRKAHERELERYETMVETSGDPMYTLDEGGNVTYANNALVELTGYREETLLGEHAGQFMEREHVQRGERLISTLLASDEVRGTFEMDLVTASGEAVPCENHVAILPSDDGFRGTVGVLRDISERVDREQRLKRERDRLDEFARVVSHDLRNPLNVASGRLELARAECESEDLAAVAAAHERIEALIGDLLTLAQQGAEVGDLESLALAGVVEESWETVVTEGASLVVDTDRTIRADRSRLGQLLENVFRNAVEHGGDDVTVTVGDVSDGFYVEDDGPGVTVEDREHVFDAGYSTSSDGTGFGMSIVREIAGAHGWSVDVTSSEEGGARFEFTAVRGE